METNNQHEVHELDTHAVPILSILVRLVPFLLRKLLVNLLKGLETENSRGVTQ